MMNGGAEWMIDAEGCSPEPLRDLQALRTVCEQIINDLDLCVVGEGQWHQFPAPGGVTGLFLLTESHLACHTYPESGIATFNLYCCNTRPEWPWQARLSEILNARQVTVRFARRGTLSEEREKGREGEREKGREGEVGEKGREGEEELENARPFSLSPPLPVSPSPSLPLSPTSPKGVAD